MATEKSPVRGLIAEYDSVEALKAAAIRVRDAGYTKTDAFTPFPVHGLEKCLGIKPTALPWIVLCCGASGTLLGLVMQIWMNSYNYPYIISGKPMLSLPAFIPVAYELTILFSSFGAFFGMLALNGLPRFSNPLFSDPRFDRATDDRFFIMIDAKDPRYQEAGVRALLESTTGFAVTEVREDDSPRQIPKWVFTTVSILGLIALIPPLFAMRMRVTNADRPRFHIFFEMDFQPKKLPQQTSTLFADGRVMRPHVPGTIARGELIEDIDYYTGIDMEKLAATDRPRSEVLVHRVLQQGDAAEPQTDGQGAGPPSTSATALPPPSFPSAAPPGSASAAAPVDTTPYLSSIPVPVTDELMQRGRERFEIYCAVCHGLDGSGNGLVAQRAREINATTWVPPSNLHQSIIQQQPDGKIFNTITNGVRKMPGYSGQINVRDRWAIVAYVRALQLSRDADRKGMVATAEVKGK